MPALLPVVAGAVALAAGDALQAAVQKVLDAQAARACPSGDSCVKGHVVQVSWKDATREFSAAAGTYHMPGNADRAADADDNFVHGSGTKTFTAAGVMALVEQGTVGLDDPLALHVDPVLDEIVPGTSLQSLWGPQAAGMTVRQSIAMRLGITDYDGRDGTFDDNLLLNTSINKLTHTPVEFLKRTAADGMQCDPGNCYQYSSASMMLASLVIMRHQPGRKSWTDFDQRWPFPAAVRDEDLANTNFVTDQVCKDVLRGPGYSSPYCSYPPKTCAAFGLSPEQSKVEVWEQSCSIMGIGGANMAAPTKDVARFIWDILGWTGGGPAPRAINQTSVQTMIDQDLGLQSGSVSEGGHYSALRGRGYPPRPAIGTWGSYLGHVGDVYGFATLEGVFYGPNASIAIATNFDDGWYTPRSGFLQDVACNVMQAYANVTGDSSAPDLKCTQP